MKNTKAWIVPGIFFLVASVLNLLGHGPYPAFAALTKPALLPLLAVTTLFAAGKIDSPFIRTLILAQLLGCTGDIFLMGKGFLPFVLGMVAFLAGHVCYISLFGRRSWKGMGMGTWLLSAAVMCAIVAGLIVAIGIKGALLAPMAVYGMTLMLLIFSTLMGVVKFKKCAWWILLCGAVLFTVSDALISTDSFGAIPFEGKSTVIMFTYLAAQALLAWGALKLYKAGE